jgi:hypothetical protein
MSRTTPTEPLSWRRIGALSSTVNLHVLAVAAAFLAMNAPRTPLDLVRAPPPPMTVELRDPPPIEAPVVPVAETVPPVSRPEPRPRPLPVVDEAIPAVATGAAASLEAPPDSRFAPVAADTASTPAVPPGEAASVAYDHAPAPAYPRCRVRVARKAKSCCASWWASTVAPRRSACIAAAAMPAWTARRSTRYSAGASVRRASMACRARRGS